MNDAIFIKETEKFNTEVVSIPGDMKKFQMLVITLNKAFKIHFEKQ